MLQAGGERDNTRQGRGGLSGCDKGAPCRARPITPLHEPAPAAQLASPASQATFHRPSGSPVPVWPACLRAATTRAFWSGSSFPRTRALSTASVNCAPLNSESSGPAQQDSERSQAERQAPAALDIRSLTKPSANASSRSARAASRHTDRPATRRPLTTPTCDDVVLGSGDAHLPAHRAGNLQAVASEHLDSHWQWAVKGGGRRG